MDKRYLTVSALNKYIKAKIDHDSQLQSILIKGEVSNLKKHSSGHYYFTLKDNNSRINAVMFSSKASKISFNLKDGDNVLIEAYVSVYDVAGTYQLYVNTIELDGIGSLFLKFEQLKKMLAKEGLFDEMHKKEIPLYPSKIAVLSAYPSAALMDIVRTIKLRFPIARVIVFPIPVQGKGAYKQIVKTIEYVDDLHFTTILIARGGGSLEDLWNFNEEELARAIYNCNTPIISGIGHEVDFTICDFVSDYRAATPTAAASKATPDINELKNNVSNMNYTLNTLMNHKIKLSKEKLNQLRSSYLFKNPDKLYEYYKTQLDFTSDKLISVMNNKLNVKKQSFDLYNNKLNHLQELFTAIQKEKIKMLNRDLDNALKQKVNHNQEKFYFLLSRLNTLSPLKTLERGYAIITKNDETIRSINDVNSGDELNIKLKDGTVVASVK